MGLCQPVGGELRGAWRRAASFGEEQRFLACEWEEEHLCVEGEVYLLMVVVGLQKFARD